MQVRNPSGLVFTFSDAGALHSIDVSAIRIGLRPPARFARPAANLYLRKRGAELQYIPLLGPESPSQFRGAEGVFEARGSWAGLDYVCTLQLSAADPSWQWQVRIESRLDHAVELDLLYMQDVGLRANAPGLVNEHYVSQYLERRVFESAQHGSVVCCRQNMREAVGHPWLMLGCAGRALTASTDGSQFYGRTYRATREPEALRAERLGGECSGESSIVALQEQPFVLRPGEGHTSAFFALYLPDHPQASSEIDLQRIAPLVRSFSQQVAAVPPSAAIAVIAASASKRERFESAPLLPSDELTQHELGELFGTEWRHVETVDGELLSFFTDGPRHVVLRAKEARVERPHGHIMHANFGCGPDDAIMSSTAFACGVFHSHITQGNTNFNTLLSVCTHPETPTLEGQRIFVQLDGAEYLLGVPSAFESGLQHCRWIYKHGDSMLQVRSWTDASEPRIHLDFKVLRGQPVRLAITHQFDDSSGWTVAPGTAHQHIATPQAQSMLAAQYPGAQFRLVVNSQTVAYRASGAATVDAQLPGSALFVLDVSETASFCVSFIGEVCGPVAADVDHADHVDHVVQDADARWRQDCDAAAASWRALSRELSLAGATDIAAISEILPWYGMNALVHFLTPYGLEQFSGAAWGTRDVCQGPVELLLSQQRYDETKQVLRVLFSHQNAEGGWPQWWMFDRYRSVRADSAHGDVIYWCVLALCSYLKASGDIAFLDEQLPYFQSAAQPTAATPVWEHIDRIFKLVVDSFVPGTALVQFGGGDWNDSLQPVSKDLARRMISSWTVEMCYQALREYSEVCARVGKAGRATELAELAGRVHADFHRCLVKDGVVAGYGLVNADRSIEVLLHPSDPKTLVHYSLLPMNRGVISGMFDRATAERHLDIIEAHLKGPDGARLMDKPLRYQGGPQAIFQRAESSTFFGREIGLMYVHEHLRYAESQARMGRAEMFLRALRQAIPVEYSALVPQGTLRQANCYYSSSDVVFKTRYEADVCYGDVLAGKLPLQGGWRVYSSGPGIYVALIVSRLLGLRVELGQLIVDPVLARSLDGLTASMRFRGRNVTFVYRVVGSGFAPRKVVVNGRELRFVREPNPYREGGAMLPLDGFLAQLDADDNRVEIEV